MELKTKYQYTYFIYPYIIKEDKYEKYLLKLLNNKNISCHFFEKEKDFDLYTYFLPNIQSFMFQDFEWNKEKEEKFASFSNEMKATLLSKYSCSMFEYNLERDVQGKVGEKDGIFFQLQKLELVCFNTGICFLLLKTNIEESNDFQDVLDFNYKFRDINSELKELKQYENIRLQSTMFSDVKELNEIIKEITGNIKDSKDVDIDTNRFLTYAYTCIEQQYWNEQNPFKDLEFEFLKYANIFPSSYKSNFNKKHMQLLGKWKFIKTAFTKEGMTLLTSSIDTHNYTKLPHVYENQYLYTYLLIQYQKIYLKKLENDAKEKQLQKDVRKKFIEFTKRIWIQEITNDDVGSNIYKKVRNVCELEKIYLCVKNKFDIAYKELNIERVNKVNRVIIVILAISLILNMINFIALLNLM